MSDVEEVKSRTNIVDVVGEYVRLQKSGINHRALCPFHNEKSPSFMVNEEKGVWHCFGCGKGGDVFSFLMEIEGLGFREALASLAQKAGIKLASYKKTDDGEQVPKQNLYRIMDLATKWYEKNLWEGSGKERVLPYLRRRGLMDETIREFRLGYAPKGWRNILDFLLKRGFSIEEIAKTGLLVEKKQTQVVDFYDRFRERIMFPIEDVAGRIVGFSARVEPGGDEKSAKYVNTPQTLLYDKGNVLYGLYRAKASVREENEAILAEGNMDVIALHQHGFKNAVAVSGTALTHDQIKILKRYAERIVLNFDMDEAGRTAAKKSAQACLENEMEVHIAVLAGGKDAAEILAEDPSSFKKSLKEAKNIVDYTLREALNKFPVSEPAGKKKIARDVLNIIKDLANPIEKSHWVSVLGERIGVSDKILFEILENLKKRKIPGRNEQPKKTQQPEKDKIIEQRLIGLILVFWRELRKMLGTIDENMILGETESKIFREFKNSQSENNPEAVRKKITDRDSIQLMDEAAFLVEVEVRERDEENRSAVVDPAAELKSCYRRLKDIRIKKRITELTEEIKAAEASGKKSEMQKLIEEVGRLMIDLRGS